MGLAWIFEVKGYPATFYKKDGAIKRSSTVRTQRRTWFIEALGQIISRMRHPIVQYGIVFPDHPSDKYFEKKALELPQFFRSKLQLWFILVGQNETMRVLTPQNDQFKEWTRDTSNTDFS